MPKKYSTYKIYISILDVFGISYGAEWWIDGERTAHHVIMNTYWPIFSMMIRFLLLHLRTHTYTYHSFNSNSSRRMLVRPNWNLSEWLY